MNNIFIGLMMFSALAWHQIGHTAIVDQDWKIPGDAALIYDTDTSLRWLDLSRTAAISNETVVANLGPGGMFEGFRLAMQSEVLDFWANAGISNSERVWVTNQFTVVKDLVDRLGPTAMLEPGVISIATHTIGMAEGGPALPPNQRWAMELTYAPDGLNSRTSANFYTWDVSAADPHFSTYLVQAVPLPTAVWLFGSGLISLFGIARCKNAAACRAGVIRTHLAG